MFCLGDTCYAFPTMSGMSIEHVEHSCVFGTDVLCAGATSNGYSDPSPTSSSTVQVHGKAVPMTLSHALISNPKEALWALQRHYKENIYSRIKPSLEVLEPELISIGRLCPPELAGMLKPHVCSLGLVYVDASCGSPEWSKPGSMSMMGMSIPIAIPDTADRAEKPALLMSNSFLVFTFSSYRYLVPGYSRLSAEDVSWNADANPEILNAGIKSPNAEILAPDP